MKEKLKEVTFVGVELVSTQDVTPPCPSPTGEGTKLPLL